MESTKKIAVISGTRADWGLLSPVAGILRGMPGVCLRIVATNMHLLDNYGHTVDEIRADGFGDEIVEIPIFGTSGQYDDSPLAKVKAMARLTDNLGAFFEHFNPDWAIILGDRYEMLGAAAAASIMHVPVAHIAGGEISRGAIDDNIRHAITKLSSLHFTATEEYRRRVIQMGESPECVIFSGALGLWNISNIPLLKPEDLSKCLNIDLSSPCALMTFHPATLDPADPGEQCSIVFDSLMAVKNMKVIVTFPNNDERSQPVIKEIERRAAAFPERVKAFKSLGKIRYLSALKCVDFVIGNSSSGLVEVPGAGIPTVNVGIRQLGRTAGPSVIHCDASRESLDKAICMAMSDDFREKARRATNPYFRENTPEIIAENIVAPPANALQPKIFHDLT